MMRQRQLPSQIYSKSLSACQQTVLQITAPFQCLTTCHHVFQPYMLKMTQEIEEQCS